MSEICFECYKKESGTADEIDFIISEDISMSESCGEYKTAVIREKGYFEKYLFPQKGFSSYLKKLFKK